MTRPAVVEQFDPDERTDGPRLEHLRRLVAQGYREMQATVVEIEARIARPEVERRARAAAEKRAAVARYPNQRRSEPRGGEAMNPARVFAALARRGLVERIARRGPGAMVRLVDR